MNTPLQTAFDKTSLHVDDTSDKLHVSTKFLISLQSNFAMIAGLFLPLTVLVLGVTFSDSLFDNLIIALLTVPLIIFCVFGITKQLTDYCTVTSSQIEFRNSLKKKSIDIARIEKVKMKSSTVEEKRRKVPRSFWRQVEIWVTTAEDEFRILDFQVNDRDSKTANSVGNAIISRLKEKITVANIRD